MHHTAQQIESLRSKEVIDCQHIEIWGDVLQFQVW